MKAALQSLIKLLMAAFVIGSLLLGFLTMFTVDQVLSFGEQVFGGFGQLFTEVTNRFG
jgi:hypothetical protein